ncbi:hypothetical protein TW85_07480 [Marinomonas sp. S3726]|uniref:hypothetical protein n=1 Tax=Marinomonas sp. S3726 TaxID=579484 RepID=UPI0005FA7EC1|nr:hypothetical protein [Marinomonas sp. S3726]KJZ14919.1 hypothetical protein TW85_07480 [Marinomonas sp. S3726]
MSRFFLIKELCLSKHRVAQILGLSVCFAGSFYMANVSAAAPVDPFAASDVPTDPFASGSETSILSLVKEEEIKPSVKAVLTQSVSAMTYLQLNDINQDHAFNPNLARFNEDKQLNALDYGAKLNLEDSLAGLSARTRILAQYEVQDLFGSSDERTDSDELKALEAYLNWYSKDYQWQAQAGRIKTEWSNGFNWNLTNLLRPYRDQPYSDQDDLLQQEGWMMASLSRNQGDWFYQALVAELEDDDLTKVSYRANQQYVLRLGYQGGADAELILHKLPGQSLNYALSVSRLLTDAMTLRAQWSLQHQRSQTTSSLLADYNGTSFEESAQSAWQQVLLGAAYTTESGANFRLEYLHSEHGFSEGEWDYISSNSDTAFTNINSGLGSSSDYAYMGSALDSLNYGQLRQNYLYFMYSSPLSDGLWQYRQSVQLNLDDDSQLHRLELLKSWNANLTSRFQFETYQGCSDCEYGLNPNENTLRAVFKWDF